MINHGSFGLAVERNAAGHSAVGIDGSHVTAGAVHDKDPLGYRDVNNRVRISTSFYGADFLHLSRKQNFNLLRDDPVYKEITERAGERLSTPMRP